MEPSTTNLTPNGAQREPAVRHSTFYFDDRTVIFRVADTLFGVHRSVFSRHSPLFREMWTLPVPEDGQGEGSSDEHPICLEGVTVKEFEYLVSILYPLEYGVTPYTTLEDWLMVAKLATKFDFEGIRTAALKAVEQLPDLTPITKITVARQHNLKPEWILSSLVELTLRSEPLTKEEIASLGLEDTANLMRAREDWVKQKSFDSISPDIYCLDCEPEDFTSNCYCANCGTDLDALMCSGIEMNPYTTPSDIVYRYFRI